MRLYLMLSLALFSGRSATAAKANEEALIAGAAVGAAITTAIAINHVKEKLEYEAVQHVLKEMPELTHFQLKHFAWTTRKASDLSNTTFIPFLVKPLDGEPFILAMVTSYGWITPTGVNMSLVRFETFDRNTWGTLLNAYLNAAGVEKSASHMEIPGFIKNPRPNVIAAIQKQNGRIVKAGDTTWGQVGTFNMGQIERITTKGVVFASDADDSSVSATFPFTTLDGDSYIVENVGPNIRVLYNENSMGLFYVDTKDLIQMKSSMVKRFSLATMNSRSEQFDFDEDKWD